MPPCYIYIEINTLQEGKTKMGKGNRNTNEKIERQVIDVYNQREDEFIKKVVSLIEKKENKRKLLNAITTLIAFLTLITAFGALHYSKQDYEYKRDPIFDIKGEGIGYKTEILPNGEKFLRYTKANFSVKIERFNSLENLYLISPDKIVERINLESNIEEQIKNHFEEAYEDEQPDVVTESGIATFYRFMVYTCHDGDIEINVLYVRGENDDEENNDPDVLGEITVDRLTKVDMLEFEQGHKDDSEYVGEKEIAQQYREIEAYLKSE